MDIGEARARGAWLFFRGEGKGRGWAHAFAGKAQQLRSSDTEQKKSESSTSHKTLSSGIVYRQTGITAPPPPPHPPPGTHNTLPHIQTKGALPPPSVPLSQHTHQLPLSPLLFKTSFQNISLKDQTYVQTTWNWMKYSYETSRGVLFHTGSFSTSICFIKSLRSVLRLLCLCRQNKQLSCAKKNFLTH